MNLVSYRNLVDVAYTEDEVKAMAVEIEVRRLHFAGFARHLPAHACSLPQVEDGPNDQGERFLRPGKLADRLPAPYANEQVRSLLPTLPFPVAQGIVADTRVPLCRLRAPQMLALTLRI